MATNSDKPGCGWNLMVIALSLAAAPWWAWVATTLWRWFVVPLGAVPIGMAHAFGLSAVVGMVTYAQMSVNKNDGYEEKERDVIRLAKAWLAPLLSLGVGAVAHALM